MNKEEDYLEKRFRELLENVPPLAADEQALDRINKSLDALEPTDRSQRLPWWYFLPYLLVIPLLSGIFYFHQQTKNASHKIEDLQLQITKNQDLIAAKTIQKTVQIYDTVYHTVYENKVITKVETRIREQIYQPLAYHRFQEAFGRPGNYFFNSDYSKFQMLGLEQPILPTFTHSSLAGFGLGNNSLTEVQAVSTPNRSWESFTSLNSAALCLLPIDFAYLATQWKPKYQGNSPTGKHRNVNPLLYMKPTGFSLGVNFLPALSFGISGKNGLGLAYGLSGELKFRKKWQLGMAVNQLRFNYKLKQNFSAYPVVTPENPQDPLKELYIDLRYLEVPVYLQYQLAAERKYHPFFNVGIISRLATRQTYKYEFNGSNGEYTQSLQIPGTSFSTPAIQGALGWSAVFNKNLEARAQMVYRHNVKLADLEYVKPNYLGLDLSLFYHFN